MSLAPLSENEKAKQELKQQIKALEQKVKKNPKDYTSMFDMVMRYSLLREFRKAGDICYKLAEMGADQIEVYKHGARSYLAVNENNLAAKIAKKGVEKFNDDIDLNIMLATAYKREDRFAEAEQIFLNTQKNRPDKIESTLALADFYMNAGNVGEGIKLLEAELEKDPESTRLMINIGSAYTRLEDFIRGSEYYIKALRISPEDSVALMNMGMAMEKMKKPEVAQEFYNQAYKLKPDDPLLICCIANLKSTIGFAQEARDDYKKGLAGLQTKYQYFYQFLIHFSNFVFYLHYVPDVEREELLKEIMDLESVMFSHKDRKSALSFDNLPNKNKKLKIGLISGGFNVHPVGQMIYGALENIDKDKFDLFCYSDTVPDRKDYLYEKIIAQCAQVRDIFGHINYDVLDTIRNDEIDILIEMTGHSEGGRRLQVAHERAAPVQVKWVGGLFNTTGIKAMDWLISDNIETPEGEDKWYTEKLYRMPDDYIVYYPPYYAPNVGEPPAKKNGFITFGNLNNVAKTNSYSIELWSKILHKVPNSKLLLKGNKMDTPFVIEHLQKSFVSHGIDIDRLLIEGGESHQAFLNVYNRIDIALDPHPYTGGLTTCEALWMGVPVVTLPGETFAGRHAATHLTNAGMPEWIAKDEQDYINIAVKWASDVDALSELRAGLRDHVAKTPLVDGPRFAKNFEIALRHMWNEWCDQKLAADKPAKVTKPKPTKSKKRK